MTKAEKEDILREWKKEEENIHPKDETVTHKPPEKVDKLKE